MNTCIIFDCDGTLVDSEAIVNKHAVEFYATHGYHVTEDEASERFIGKTMTDIQTAIFEISGIQIPGELWFSSKTRAKLYADYAQNLQPLMRHTLDNLMKHNMPRCVASNSHLDHIFHTLTQTNQKSYFQDHHIFSAQHVARGKPAPDLFLHACDQMGFAPKDCIVIEDSVAGIEAALAANIPVIGFIAGAHAQKDWYQARIRGYNIPIANNSIELWQMLSASVA